MSFFALSFILYYTVYFSMHHYARFSQIGSQLSIATQVCTDNVTRLFFPQDPQKRKNESGSRDQL